MSHAGAIAPAPIAAAARSRSRRPMPSDSVSNAASGWCPSVMCRLLASVRSPDAGRYFAPRAAPTSVSEAREAGRLRGTRHADAQLAPLDGGRLAGAVLGVLDARGERLAGDVPLVRAGGVEQLGV